MISFTVVINTTITIITTTVIELLLLLLLHFQKNIMAYNHLQSFMFYNLFF